MAVAQRGTLIIRFYAQPSRNPAIRIMNALGADQLAYGPGLLRWRGVITPLTRPAIMGRPKPWAARSGCVAPLRPAYAARSFMPETPDCLAQWAQQKVWSSASTPWPMMRQPQCAHRAPCLQLHIRNCRMSCCENLE